MKTHSSELPIKRYSQVYFIGIGGIGMSALARYFSYQGGTVSGYDLTPSEITDALLREGMEVLFTDEVAALNLNQLTPTDTLVVYTPAIPKEHAQLNYFRSHGYSVCKRAEALGLITSSFSPLCVAGTHGKTTTSTMLTHFLSYGENNVGCSAFLGGIANNYKTNFLYSQSSPYVVIEADEFDRSFHHLTPQMAIITSTDPDHLDIYGTHANYLEAFNHFASLIKPNGCLVMKEGLSLSPSLQKGVRVFTYGESPSSDFYYDNIVIEDGQLCFDWHYPAEGICLRQLSLGVPVRINVENATAAMALAYFCGVSLEQLRAAVASFSGSHRRFESVLSTSRYHLIDDYAHHPTELEASINSICELYAHQEVLAIFQPHLYSRTQDFYQEFAQSLSKVKHVILLDIYPARELPIEGVSSQLIYDLIATEDKHLLSREELLPFLQQYEVPPVVLMLGAGNIDRLVLPVKEFLMSQS